MSFAVLKYTDHLVEVGVDEQQAKAQVLYLNDSIESPFAAKRDLKEIDFKIEGVKKDIENLRVEFKRDIKELELKLIVKLGGDAGGTETVKCAKSGTFSSIPIYAFNRGWSISRISLIAQ